MFFDDDDFTVCLDGYVIIAEAIDRANALKAIEIRLNNSKLDGDMQEFLDKCIKQATEQYKTKGKE